MILRKITKDELNSQDMNFLTVGELKKFLSEHNLPDDATVLIQRVEDIYYEKYSWGVYLKEGNITMKDENGNFIEDSLEQYHPASHCTARYKNEDNFLFIDLHY